MKHGVREAIFKKSVFKNKFLNLYEVQLNLKNGKTRIHYNVERIPTVTVIPLTPNYEVYLISHYRYILDRIVVEAVAGTVDEDEGILACAKRELHEETGIIAKKLSKLGTFNLAGSFLRANVTIFLAQDLTLGEPKPEEDEEITLVKLPFEEAVEKVIKGEITTAASVIGILLIDRLKREGKL